MPAAEPVAPCPCGSANITSETVATVPADRTRTTVGVGERVRLTYSLGSATWTKTGGRLSSTSGATTTFTAPSRAATVTITAKDGNACTATIDFTVIEPSGVSMRRKSGTGVWHANNIPSVGMKLDIYITPDTVSFENIEIMESDCVGAVTGYFVGTTLDGIHHAGHGAGTWVTVGTVRAGRGSKVDGTDTAQSGHCNFGQPYADGTFDWPIPWNFRVNGGSEKRFATVHQRFIIDAAGAMTVRKGGARANAALADAISGY